MTEQQTIVVAGATGAQGGGVVNALLADPEYRFAVRAITRNPASDAARDLAGRGAEVVVADFADRASLDTAFEGAYGAFLVTNFWAHGSADQETQEIRNLVDVVKAAQLQHVVWSTLEDTRELLPLEDDRMPVLQDHYNVPHFDAKGEGNQLFRYAGIPTTFLNTTFFYQGFLQGMGPKRADDGSLVLSLPFEDGKRLAGIDVDDIGRTAVGILQRGRTLVGQTVSIAGDHLTGQQYADIIGDVVGEPVAFRAVPYDLFRSLGLPAGDEIANMFQYYGDFDSEFTGARNLDQVRTLNPSLQDFATWAHQNADGLRAAI